MKGPRHLLMRGQHRLLFLEMLRFSEAVMVLE